MFESITISMSKDDSTEDTTADWVKIEQIMPSNLSQYASLSDVYQLWLAAATGKSAQTMRAMNCPVEFVGSEVHVMLGMYVWPSRPDLIYSLSASIGTIGSKQNVQKKRESSIFINNSNRAELDYYMSSVNCEWETPCFDRYGSAISPPSITLHGTWLEFSTEVFGALRVSGTAVGISCVCEMILVKELTEEELTDEEIGESQVGPNGELIYTPPETTRLSGYKIENLQNTITAYWTNEDGTADTEQLRLEIPQCVQDILAFCPNMYQTVLLWCQRTATHQVYYNACTGDVMFIISDVDPLSYCSKTVIPGTTEGRPSWLPNPSLWNP